MDEKKISELINKGRNFVRSFNDEYEDYETDQQLKKPQPPLAKERISDTVIALPRNFSDLETDNDFLHVISSRKSHRVYTDEEFSLLQLSFLLWCTQGVREIRGKSYATLRTVPSGGARHPFECYMAVRKVSGLKPGLYHYLPMRHELEYLGSIGDMEEKINVSLFEQAWACKASVVFYYSAVFYRAEWRYGIYAHVPLLIDSGHITENLYLALTSLNLGGCAIAAVDHETANTMFSLDGEEETIFYAMSAGTVSEKDRQSEKDFYAFVDEQGL